MRVCDRSKRSRSGSLASSIISASFTQLPRRFTAVIRPALSRSTLPPSFSIQPVSADRIGASKKNTNRSNMALLRARRPAGGSSGLIIVKNLALWQSCTQSFVRLLGHWGVVQVERLECRHRLQYFGAAVRNVGVVQ